MHLFRNTNPVILCLFVSFFYSCIKNNSSDREAIVPGPNDSIPQFAVSETKFTSSSKFLKREISVIQSNPFVNNVKLFSYDNVHRCIEIKLGTIDSSATNPTFNLKQTLTFNYEGSSIVPSSFSSVRTALPNLVRVYYYLYNSQGRKIRDSIRAKNTAGDPADRVVHYVYDKDRVYITPVLSGFPIDNNPFDTLSLFKGGNIEKLSSKTTRSAGDQFSTYTFTYDRMINPYNKLNIANSLYFESPSLGLGYNVPKETHYMGVTTNNMTSWTSGTFTLSFKYVYDQEGYPVKREVFMPNNTSPVEVVLLQYN